MSAEYSVEEVRVMAVEISDYGGTQAGLMLTAYADLREQIGRAKAVAEVKPILFGIGIEWANGKNVADFLGAKLYTHPTAQAAQVDDKVVVIRDGKTTAEGLVLAASIYMGAVKDIFALRQDGPPYNERKVTKDTGALRAFDHLDAATKALRSAISHFIAPTAEPAAQGEAAAVIMALQREIDDHGVAQIHAAELATLSAQPRAVPDGWTRDKAKLHERKTVHEWLNDLHIEYEEFGKPLCLLRRLRILCDRYLAAAPPIDLAAVREVIASLYAPGHPAMAAAANKLEAAIAMQTKESRT